MLSVHSHHSNDNTLRVVPLVDNPRVLGSLLRHNLCDGWFIATQIDTYSVSQSPSPPLDTVILTYNPRNFSFLFLFISTESDRSAAVVPLSDACVPARTRSYFSFLFPSLDSTLLHTRSLGNRLTPRHRSGLLPTIEGLCTPACMWGLCVSLTPTNRVWLT